MRFVDDDRETAVGQIADAFHDMRESLHRGDDDLLARLQVRLQLREADNTARKASPRPTPSANRT